MLRYESKKKPHENPPATIPLHPPMKSGKLTKQYGNPWRNPGTRSTILGRFSMCQFTGGEKSQGFTMVSPLRRRTSPRMRKKRLLGDFNSLLPLGLGTWLTYWSWWIQHDSTISNKKMCRIVHVFHPQSGGLDMIWRSNIRKRTHEQDGRKGGYPLVN